MRDVDSGSLDMLLDAMSNAFGSIILICLLFALSPEGGESADCADADFQKVQSISEAAEILERSNGEAARELVKLEAELSTDGAIAKISDIDKRIAMLRKVLSDAEQTLKNRGRDSFNADSDEVDSSIKADEELKKIQNELSFAIDQKRIAEKNFTKVKADAFKIRAMPPLMVPSKKRRIWIEVKQDRFFVFTPATAASDCILLGDVFFANPKASSWNGAKETEIEKFLASINSQSDYAAFSVWPDDISHATFRKLLGAISKKKINYFWRSSSEYLGTFSQKGLAPSGVY